jgi:NAD(P)-dependent dehydrogenase (short-subunit alcohol dehydrogenase family)
VQGRLEGRVAIITGSGGIGLGRAGAVLFASEGARVAVLDVDEAGIEETLRQVEAAGGEAIGVRTDVSKLGEVEAMVETVLEAYTQLDILWNNAAVIRSLYTPAEEIPVEDWHTVINVNLTGYFYCAKAVIPHMKARRSGAILFGSAWGALIPVRAGAFAYAVTKASALQMARQLAVELGPYNIRVNAIAGGSGGTPGSNEPVPDESPFGGLEHRLGLEGDMPITGATRRPTPEELARAALYLVDDASGPLTGVTLSLDGGRTARAFT